jgi:hypothetical protein
MNEDSTHDQLTKAFLEYFKWHEKFEKKPSEVKKRETRRWLSNIRRLATKRRQEVIEKQNLKIIQKGEGK